MNPSLPLSFDDLRQRHQAGASFSYLLFWGHRPRADGRASASCFSQWFDAPFDHEGQRYATAEHFMMAEKARLFGDQEARAKALSAPTPDAAKKVGRQVRGFDEAKWVQHRFDIVVQANRAKFAQHHAMAAFLRDTGDQVLVEASPYDTIWGIGLGAKDERCQNPQQWRGLNLLGFALMVVRAELQAGERASA